LALSSLYLSVPNSLFRISVVVYRGNDDCLPVFSLYLLILNDLFYLSVCLPNGHQYLKLAEMIRNPADRKKRFVHYKRSPWSFLRMTDKQIAAKTNRFTSLIRHFHEIGPLPDSVGVGRPSKVMSELASYTETETIQEPSISGQLCQEKYPTSSAFRNREWLLTSSRSDRASNISRRVMNNTRRSQQSEAHPGPWFRSHTSIDSGGDSREDWNRVRRMKADQFQAIFWNHRPRRHEIFWWQTGCMRPRSLSKMNSCSTTIQIGNISLKAGAWGAPSSSKIAGIKLSEGGSIVSEEVSPRFLLFSYNLDEACRSQRFPTWPSKVIRKEITTWMSILDSLWKMLVFGALAVTLEFVSARKVIKACWAVRSFLLQWNFV
jgi:hypothetical protein